MLTGRLVTEQSNLQGVISIKTHFTCNFATVFWKSHHSMNICDGIRNIKLYVEEFVEIANWKISENIFLVLNKNIFSYLLACYFICTHQESLIYFHVHLFIKFCLHYTAYGILVPWPGKPWHLKWKHGVLTTEPPGSPMFLFEFLS